MPGAAPTQTISESWKWVASLAEKDGRDITPPLIMGILNTTPDSFFDSGNFDSVEQGIERGLELLSEGADILDVGGESTRPPGKDYGTGSPAVAADEEIARVIPVIEGIIAAAPNSVISIDTVKPEVASAAISAGATIINDVSAGEFDEQIWEVAAEADIPYILMHGHNPAKRVPVDQIIYSDVVEDVSTYLGKRIEKAASRGVRKIIADPGIGFAKGAKDSGHILRELGMFRRLGLPLLVGASRKSFIGRMLGGVPPSDRLYGTIAAQAVAALNGAAIIRLHDVRPAVDFFKIFAALQKSPLPFTEGFREG
ncbi:MAG: dihydropteroate synthase [Candidatus Kapaibacterium sp.]|nr:dihydropteroate synthase [Ignavibacteria bacterium]